MLIQHHRDKLLNVIMYFAQNTVNCGKTKLYKLLYFLDFQHYAEVGRSVTGLEYYAWPMGPVPVELHEEMDNPRPDLRGKMEIDTIALFNAREMLSITPKAEFDSTHFTRRELKMMRDLCERYRDSTAQEMIEATHLENLPWHQVYEVQGLRQQLIPYSYALRKSEKDLMRQVIEDHDDILRNYG